MHQFTGYLAPLVGEVNARARAYTVVYQTVVEQAQLAAYVRIFQILSVLSGLCVVGLLFFKKVKAGAGAVAADCVVPGQRAATTQGWNPRCFARAARDRLREP